MASSRPREETLRLQFGTAANTLGAQLYTLEKANDGNPQIHRSDGKPRLIAFEAKGRIHRKVSATHAVERGLAERDLPDAWDGGVQMYDQAQEVSAASSRFLPSTAYWSWDNFSDKNLFEVEEFRPYMQLHNMYEGQSASRDGVLSGSTMDKVEDRLRGVLEESDNLRCVENFVDMDSSWAGLSLEVLTYLSEECPSAVVVTFGNDWKYPLADQTEADLYSAGIDSRDRSKIEARRGVNLLSSVAMLMESSSVFIPVGLSGSSRRHAINDSRPELLAAATFAATAIDIALSEFRTTPAATIYSLLDGILPSMKALELSARFPLAENPSTLIDEATSMSLGEYSKWNEHSLLPFYTPPRSRAMFGSTTTRATSIPPPPRFRRVHFRGAFETHASSLQASLGRFAPANTVASWTREALYVASASAEVSMDAASQLTLSHAVGSFFYDLAMQTNRSDRRVLYEFTQAGMNVDAIEELQATLRATSEAYPQLKDAGSRRALSDDEDEMDDETVV